MVFILSAHLTHTVVEALTVADLKKVAKYKVGVASKAKKAAIIATLVASGKAMRFWFQWNRFDSIDDQGCARRTLSQSGTKQTLIDRVLMGYSLGLLW